MVSVFDVRFEHYHGRSILGVQESCPRLSWKVLNTRAVEFKQAEFEAELTEQCLGSGQPVVCCARRSSQSSTFNQWPFAKQLQSRQRVAVRIRLFNSQGDCTPWSPSSRLEVGLLDRADWRCERITAPWAPSTPGPHPELLFRKEFSINGPLLRARLYITTQGVYEAEINGQRVGNHFLAPVWTTYDGRLQYQTYDIADLLSDGDNCIGVRIAEGWFSGRIGFEGGLRNIWGPYNTLLAQLEITGDANEVDYVLSDNSWSVSSGPIRLAELYDGEKYDGRLESQSWSLPTTAACNLEWERVIVLSPLPTSIELTAGFSEPVRRVEVVKPVQKIISPLGNLVVDFGQNLVGYVRLKGIRGPRGHKITCSHAEVLEGGELGTRPLRICKAVDEYILGGFSHDETYEPRFTFHGFRYAQVDGWPGEIGLDNLEAVVCHTDMEISGSFACSDPLINQLHANIVWSMRGNFLSVPTDCPQRDERLGWSGDLAIFASTAPLLYNCFGMLKNWLVDVAYDQRILAGVPSMVTPNSMLPDPKWLRKVPCAIWHDVTILAPWALYEETGDPQILTQQFDSMTAWLKVIPRGRSGHTAHLWDPSVYQLGDWLDPAAPPESPWKSSTDSKMVANAFLVQSLTLMAKISAVLRNSKEDKNFLSQAQLAREAFRREYVTANGRLVSDSQTAYALAICFDLLDPSQMVRAGERLAELVRKNNFMIATGFAGTPFLLEALARTGQLQVAYATLLGENCPSWLYPVTMGATTVWERWDSMLSDASINPGEMTSFNHYALGAVAKFLHERIAGLQRVDAGWKRFRVAPSIGASFSHASAHHSTLYGTISCSWTTSTAGEGLEMMELKVTVPYGTTAEVVIPDGEAEKRSTVGAGDWSFQTTFRRSYTWPVPPLKAKS